MPEDLSSKQVNDSPHWGNSAKVIVALVSLLLVALIGWRFQALIAQVVIAAIIAYILNPAIVLVNARTTVSRGIVIAVIYLILALLVAWAMVALGVAAFQQLGNLIEQVPDLISDLLQTFEDLTLRTEPIFIGSYAIDPSVIPWDGITNQVLGLAEPVLGQGGQLVRQVAASTIRTVANLFFIFVISIYIARDIPQLGGYIGDFAQRPGYRKDAERLMSEFGRIWSAYLRGQVILGLVVGLVVWLGLAILGVQNALALGLLSGVLEFIPILGPVIGAGAAMVVALFQPQNVWAISGWQFALLVLALMFLIQQVENNVLVPNIVGEALDMHPLLVMIGVFMGGAVAGVLGAILAAPLTATIKLLGVYAWRKMFDMPPFPEEEAPSEPPPSKFRRGLEAIKRLGQKLRQRPMS